MKLELWMLCGCRLAAVDNISPYADVPLGSIPMGGFPQMERAICTECSLDVIKQMGGRQCVA